MGTNCAVFLANFYLFTYEFHKLCNVRRFVDDVFVPDIPFFQEFLYINSNALGGGIYPKDFCELNCTSNSDSCAFLDLKISQSSFGFKVDNSVDSLVFVPLNLPLSLNHAILFCCLLKKVTVLIRF